MTSLLAHSPAAILQAILIDDGQAASPMGTGTADSDWQVFAASEPNYPDLCITVFNTEGRHFGATMPAGAAQEKHGLQLRFRSNTPDVGYQKARAVSVHLDEGIYNKTITLDSSTYLVQCVRRVGTVLNIGKNTPSTLRSLFTVNAVMTVKQTA